MSDDSTQSTPVKLVEPVFRWNEYRCYLTPEHWLITYRDADFVKVMRNTSHKAGFALILVELIWDLCRGTRSALADRWAVHSALARGDARELIHQQRAAENRVIEFWFERQRSQTSRAIAGEEPER